MLDQSNHPKHVGAMEAKLLGNLIRRVSTLLQSSHLVEETEIGWRAAGDIFDKAHQVLIFEGRCQDNCWD
jgi:hypothetical protein